jgi:hypothetical protein
MVPGAGPDTWPVLLSAGPGGTRWLEDGKQDRNKCQGLYLEGQVGTHIGPSAENIKTRQQSPQGDLKGSPGTPLVSQHPKEHGWAALMVLEADRRSQGCSLLTLELYSLLVAALKITNQFRTAGKFLNS